LVDDRDQLRRRGVRDLKRLRRGPFASTGPVLAESYFLLPEAHLRRRLRFLVGQLGVEVVELSADQWEDVFDWLDRYEEHQPDLADAQMVVLSARRPDCRVWTYDREFRTTWRRPDGSPIPLAVDPARR
jgi:hypothetical protein